MARFSSVPLGTVFVCTGFFLAAAAYAQETPLHYDYLPPVAAMPSAAAGTIEPPKPPPPPTYEPRKFAVLQTLDKLTARTETITVPVGQATAVGPLFVDVKACQKTPPTELPESAAFLQVWEAKPKPRTKKKTAARDDTPSQWVFSGWMFASSPALSAMNHAVYDVWVKDCVNSTAESKQK